MIDIITSKGTKNTNISMMPTASSQIFEKIFNRFLREAHQIGKGTSKDTKNTNYPMTPQRHRFLIDFQKIFNRFLREAHQIGKARRWTLVSYTQKKSGSYC